MKRTDASPLCYHKIQLPFMSKRILFFCTFFITTILSAQTTQTVRGTVTDIQSELPLIGATIELLDSTIRLGATTDLDGNFTIQRVPTGRKVFKISFLGYDATTIPNVLVTTGKEVVLQVKLQESFSTLNEVVISGGAEKDKTVNELATISARQFDVEEVRRYSGGRNDVAKLVANFAGVSATNDQRNDIVIRGNSPTGVLWRLEGVPIPNPNHFSTLGTTGGPVSALNPNMIGNSDFLTGAFPAEYGNALAGVFDINLRKGNTEKYEFTAQLAAFTGFEAMIEGPVNKKGGSFVAAYRHSFVELAAAAGLNIGTQAVPAYKDLSFNLDFGNQKFGKLSIFGIGALSDIDFIAAKLDSNEIFVNPNQNSYSTSNFAVLGMKHSYQISERAYLRTVISGTKQDVTFFIDDLKVKPGREYRVLDVRDQNMEYRAHTYLNTKWNSRLHTRFGAQYTRSGLDAFVQSREFTPDLNGDGDRDWFAWRDQEGTFQLAELYGQSQYRMNQKWTLNAGLHSQYFDFTKQAAIEPRLAINYQIHPAHRINLGYGLHSQTQPFPILLSAQSNSSGVFTSGNTDLRFTRSNHFVLGHDARLGKSLRMKTEVFYQAIGRVPVDTSSTSFSVLNLGDDFGFPQMGVLQNTGKGTNLGLEWTLEKFFSNQYYGLITTTLYDAQYQGSDKIERQTAFSSRYVVNALVGKEWSIGKSGRTLTLDTKLTAAGGRPYTPIDFDASKAAGQEVFITEQAYTLRQTNYFRWDVKVGYRKNSSKRKFSQTFYVDFQNVTNNKNIFRQQYNTVTEKIGTVYQIGFLPDLLWRVEF
jgi:CarboxypepD_reg-like domain/TonB-dependent Receptor Plug Domain